jgi:hypothetical protein
MSQQVSYKHYRDPIEPIGEIQLNLQGSYYHYWDPTEPTALV